MSSLRDKIFYRAINDSLDRLRNEMCLKYGPKKESRFFVNRITYELGVGQITREGVEFEISSKIPNELFPNATFNARYFKEVRDIMMKAFKKPQDVKMENIVRSLNINEFEELKERDYVKCTYFFKNEELYTEADIDKIIQSVNGGTIQLPDIPGTTTLGGKAVIFRMQESIYGAASRLVAEFIKANDAAITMFAEIAKTINPAAKKPDANGSKPFISGYSLPATIPGNGRRQGRIP